MLVEFYNVILLLLYQIKTNHYFKTSLKHLSHFRDCSNAKCLPFTKRLLARTCLLDEIVFHQILAQWFYPNQDLSWNQDDKHKVTSWYGASNLTRRFNLKRSKKDQKKIKKRHIFSFSNCSYIKYLKKILTILFQIPLSLGKLFIWKKLVDKFWYLFWNLDNYSDWIGRRD